MYIPIKITIPRVEAQRILRKPSSSRGVVVAGAVVLQFDFGVVFAAGVFVTAAEVGICLRYNVAEGVIADGILQLAFVVGDVADGALVIGKIPEGIVISAQAGEELVDDVGAQVAGFQVVAGVQVEDHVPILVAGW